MPFINNSDFEDKNLYNQIELIYSFCVIFNILFDFGLRGYSLIHYEILKEKNNIQ